MAQVLCFVRVVLCLLLMVYGFLHLLVAIGHVDEEAEFSLPDEGPHAGAVAVVGLLLVVASLVLFPGVRP